MEPGELKAKIAELEAKIAERDALLKEVREKAQERVMGLEAEVRDLKSKASDASHRASESGGRESVEIAPINEADVTLRRLVQRIAMIIQAEKIVIMFYDRDKQELIGMPPSYGFDEERLPFFRVKAGKGISGTVFESGEPAIFHDANTDPRVSRDMLSVVNVRNGITVPLIIEKRDEENRVIDRTTIGVLHAFDKRHNEDFNEEDVRLLERMSRNVGSIIANLQLYREVIEEREELLQTFESLSAGLILVSPEMKISQMNASARAIFGVEADVVGQESHLVINIPALESLIDLTLKGEEQDKVEFTVHVAGIERFYESQAAQVKNEEGKNLGVVVIFNDVTEIRNIDRMKSSFVAMASHELRTPLTAIKGFVSTLLIDDSFSVEDRREFHMIIDQECDRLTRLINDLLNTARIEAKESLRPYYEEVETKYLLEKCVMIQRQTTQKHEIVLDAPETLPNIVADRDKLEQAVTNLLNNAIKYSPGGGTITLSAKIDGENLLIGIADQGLGIPKDHLNKLFERFHRVNNEDNRKIYGTGLGLFLTKHLIEQIHLGKIWVESEVGKGSTFWFHIPLHLNVEEAKQINS